MNEVFKMLDSDGDGVISSDKIDLSQIATKLLDILTPFFVKMEADKKTFDLDSFTKEIKLFFKVRFIIELIFHLEC